MAERLERVDLESAALDGIASAHQSLGRYGAMEDPIRRRLELAPKLSDPYEVGDIHAMAAWWALSTGRYRESVELADRGFTEAMPESPIQGLYCLDFRAAARFRVGDWDGVLADVALAEELLGDRRDTPPGFAPMHLVIAAFIHDARGDRGTARSVPAAGPMAGGSRGTTRFRPLPVASATARSPRGARGSSSAARTPGARRGPAGTGRGPRGMVRGDRRARGLGRGARAGRASGAPCLMGRASRPSPCTRRVSTGRAAAATGGRRNEPSSSWDRLRMGSPRSRPCGRLRSRRSSWRGPADEDGRGRTRSRAGSGGRSRVRPTRIGEGARPCRRAARSIVLTP